MVKENVRKRIRGTVVSTGTHHNFSWNNVHPRLVITSDTSDFDRTIVDHFIAEGFQITYIEYDGDKKAYVDKLRHIADTLEPFDKYAIVGEHARICRMIAARADN